MSSNDIDLRIILFLDLLSSVEELRAEAQMSQNSSELDFNADEIQVKIM